MQFSYKNRLVSTNQMFFFFFFLIITVRGAPCVLFACHYHEEFYILFLPISVLALQIPQHIKQRHECAYAPATGVPVRSQHSGVGSEHAVPSAQCRLRTLHFAADSNGRLVGDDVFAIYRNDGFDASGHRSVAGYILPYHAFVGCRCEW